MAQANPASPRPPTSPASAGALPRVRLELRQGATRATTHEVSDVGFLIGSVPGCDLRLPGADLPPVICLIGRHAAGACLRKLVPTHPVLVNGKPVSSGPLGEGDRIALGPVELLVHVQAAPKAEPAPTPSPPPRIDAQREQQLRELLASLQQVRQSTEAEASRLRQELAEQENALAAARQDLDEREQAFTLRREELARQQQEALERDLGDRSVALQAREQQLAKDREVLEKNQAQYQADLVRLDRQQAAFEERQQQLQEQLRQIEQRARQLQQTGLELEEQARQLDEWHGKLQAEADRLAKQKAEQEATAAPLAQRTAMLEGQQAMLTALRTRLERMREEQRREEQQLATQRAQLDATDIDLQQRVQDAQRLRAELDNDKQLRDQERRQFEERRTVLETAVTQLRQVQEKLTTEEDRLRLRVLAVNAAADEQAEQASVLRARGAQVLEMQQRLTADRQALRERETAVAQGEQVREALQEQLRRRSEELATRQRTLAEQARQQAEEVLAVETRRAEVERERAQAEERLATLRQELDGQIAACELRQAELAQRAEQVDRQVNRLKEAGRNLGAGRKAFYEERRAWEAAQREAAEAMARAQAEITALRQELVQLAQQLPDLELRGQAAVERLAQAREQLREHLAELHAYARQSQDDLEALRHGVQTEAEQVRQQNQALHRAREEHRLAVAAFRQQLIEWQGQVSEMKRTLAQDGTRLERRQAQVDEQARRVDATSARLARQVEQIQEQERVVAEDRQEMERHLAEMREWYRRKLRELSERRQAGVEERAARIDERALSAEEGASGPSASIPAPQAAPDILSLTDEIEPGDQKLGELLRSLELIDADTLTRLLVEARRQRRSLRQILLAGGYLTLYQMALMEAGNLDGLVLGPVRVIDRLRTTPREAIYRVFDPRRGQEAVLRHLAESEMQDAVHPDEFRQRFAQAAAIQHPHLAATWEVLEISGRPAALQEWVPGLPSTEWPPMVAAPGVWFRLLSQAALGLHTAHQAGMAHGHLQPQLALLTGEGIVKWGGLGEPPWLRVPPIVAVPGDEMAADLAMLGQIASAWATPGPQRKTAKIKPLPESLRAILNRLTAETMESRYASAAALLEDLEQAGVNVPANPEAWERLLRYVREHAAADAVLRQSA
jgi:hypothetical protein